MDKKHLRLPKEGLVEPEERTRLDGGSDDVEGHGVPLTAPPSIGKSSPGHGGENIPTDDEDDVEGHKRH
jgi:hypothetical protein